MVRGVKRYSVILKDEHTPLTKCVSGYTDEMQSPPLPSPVKEGTFSCQVSSLSLLVLLADCHLNIPYCSGI